MRRTMILLSIVALSACATERQERAATTGAVIGGATGAAIGSQSHQTAQGAVIGATIGAVAGAVIAAPDPQPIYVTPRHHHVVRKTEGERRHWRRED